MENQKEKEKENNYNSNSLKKSGDKKFKIGLERASTLETFEPTYLSSPSSSKTTSSINQLLRKSGKNRTQPLSPKRKSSSPNVNASIPPLKMDQIYNSRHLIFAAVKSRNTKDLYELLSAGHDVNVTDNDNQTPLHVAAADKGAEGVMLVLLAFNANVNASDKNKWTPLHVACHVGNLPACKLLIGRGADVQAKAENQIIPIQYLVRSVRSTTTATEHKDFMEVIFMMVHKGTNLSHQTSSGETVLHYCLYGKCSTELMRWLLKKGADPNLKAEKGLTVLHIAVMQKKTELVKLLLAYNANPSSKSVFGTPLEIAQTAQLQKILKEPLERKNMKHEDPRKFLENVVLKKLGEMEKENVVDPNEISQLIEQINSWMAKNPYDANHGSNILSPQSPQSPRYSPRVSNSGESQPQKFSTQMMSSDELILAIGKGIPPNSSGSYTSLIDCYKPQKPSIGPYHLGGLIGKGAVGKVFKAFNANDGEFVAIKEISLVGLPADARAKVFREVNILRKLDHKHIVKYIDVHHEENTINLVMEFIEAGTALDKVQKYGNYSEALLSKLLSEMLDCLSYIHKEGIVHRDIKGANIMLTKDGSAKLTDFGIASHFEEGQKLQSCVGTPYWMAPELISCEGYSASCDIWSLGCLAIELLTGSPPFAEMTPLSAMFRIAELTDENSVPLPPCSPELQSFLSLCFRRNPSERPSAEILKRHPFISKSLVLPPSTNNDTHPNARRASGSRIGLPNSIKRRNST